MKRFVYFVILLVYSGLGCDTEHDPIPKEEQFLKNVVVNGAKDVKLDLAERTIQILLPESFKSDIVDINVTLYPGASMNIEPWDNSITDDAVHFYFKGLPPKQFGVIKKKNGAGSLTKSYTIYVKHEGEIGVELSSPILLYPRGIITGETSDYAHTTIKFKSGIGTIPDAPLDSKVIIPELKDASNNFTIKGFHYPPGAYFSFENTAGMLSSNSISLSITYGDRHFLFPGIQKIFRAPTRALLDADYKFFKPIPKEKQIEVEGGFFLSDLSYRAKLENDFLPNPIWLNVKVENSSVLKFSIPGSVSDGNYLISIIESDSVITTQSYNILSDPNSMGIGHLWVVERSCPSSYTLVENASPTTMSKGQKFYFRPFPAITHGQNIPVDFTKKLPHLELKNGAFSIILIPATKAESCYADNSAVMYYGEYTVPASMPSGKYEVRAINEDGRRSRPYWNVITIE